MKRKILRLQAYAELLENDLVICREKGQCCIPGPYVIPEVRIRGWLYRDFLLSVYLLIFDRQKEQRSVSCRNVFDLLVQQQAEETRSGLEALWNSSGGFYGLYQRVEECGRRLLQSRLRRPLKMVRDKMLTHHEVTTEGGRRRPYNLSDFPGITPEAMQQLLGEAAVFINNFRRLVDPGSTQP